MTNKGIATKRHKKHKRFLCFLCLFVAISFLSRLGDRVDDDGLTFLHDLDSALECRSHVFRIRDWTDAGEAIRLGHLRVIDVRLDKTCADVRAVDTAIALSGHALHE